MRYALLIYNDSEVLDRRPQEEQRRINDGIYEVMRRPNVSGWLRLRNVEAATTVRYEHSRTLLTDGPFVDSKDYLGGFIVVEAENLDGAPDDRSHRDGEPGEAAVDTDDHPATLRRKSGRQDGQAER